MNYYDLKFINLNHYIKVDSDYVLVNIADYSKIDFVRLGIQIVDSSCQTFLASKLNSRRKGLIFANPEGEIVCISKKIL